MLFDEDIYYGYLVKGELRAALEYADRFTDQAERCQKIRARFENDSTFDGEIEPKLAAVLRYYCEYYRDVFYFKAEETQAEEKLREKLTAYFDKPEDTGLCVLEEQAALLFEKNGFHFLGGRTAGYRGPYIWKETLPTDFQVELPDGVQTYRVNFLDGFIMRSWLDYISLGEISTGGWTDGDGVINCVKASYDIESEAFKVSLLKHEAQHAQDLQKDPGLSSEILEYRAKLVELIYSKERSLLRGFINQTDGADPQNGHTVAASRIAVDFCRVLSCDIPALLKQDAAVIRSVALRLFDESSRILFRI